MLLLVFSFQLAGRGAVTVWVIVAVGVVGFFEFGDGGLDGEGAMIVQAKRATAAVGAVQLSLEGLMGL